MRGVAPCLAFLALLPLAGCMVSAVPSPSSSPTSKLSGNWQIQSGRSITPNPEGAFVLLGALQDNGSQVAGVFNTSSVCGGALGVSFAYTGSVDSMNNLTLTSTMPGVLVQLAVPADPTQVAMGTVAGGGLGSNTGTGPICQVISGPQPAVGVEIASLSGSFSGPVSPTAPPNLPLPPTVSLTLTQSVAPNANGQFPVTGDVTYTLGGCSVTTAMSGTVSGVGIALISGPAPVAGQNYVSFAGSTNPAATQLTISNVVFQPTPCATGTSSATTYVGSLNRR